MVSNIQKITIKKYVGITNIGDICYVGTDKDDTFTIEKGGCLSVNASGMNFKGGNDKFVINGTLLVNNPYVITADKLAISGNGYIAAQHEIIGNLQNDYAHLLEKSQVKFLDLGDTAKGFRGADTELADNNRAVAIDWEWNVSSYEIEGWLSDSETGFEDECDILKFKADFDGLLEFSGLNETYDKITINGTEISGLDWSSYHVAAGTEYTIKLERDGADSTSYSISYSYL